MTNRLPGVPEELLIKILSHLDAASLARCSLTCKPIYETIKHSSLLAYTIQLHLDGLKDTGMSEAPHADRLEYLLRYRQTWLALEWVGPITLQFPCCGFASKLVGDAFAYKNRERIAQIISLPTSNKAKKYTSQNAKTGTLVMTFTMDPTQDVIVLLCDDETRPLITDTRIVRIHIRTMSTDIPHPSAHDSCLMLAICPSQTAGDWRNLPTSPALHIAHNIVALTFNDPSQKKRVMIWDWTTSDLILDSSVALDPLLPPLQYGYEFGLIDPTYCLFISPVNSGSIRLYKFTRSSGVTTPPIHLATLHLPPISPASGTSIRGATTQAGPIMAHTNSHVPLVVNEADRLHVFAILYNVGPVSGMSINLFVHQRVFMKYVSHYADTGEGPPLDIPWIEWGPQNTRIIQPASRQHHSRVHGQRVVQPLHTNVDPRLSTSVEILDFSLAAVLAAQGILPRPPLSSMNPPGVLASSSILRHPSFQGDVETHLPYVSSTRDLKTQPFYCTINEESIINVEYKRRTIFLNIYTV